MRFVRRGACSEERCRRAKGGESVWGRVCGILSEDDAGAG